MKLIKVTIDAYKTIAHPQELLIDPKATILVGANESGKTNVLEAIEFLSPSKELKKEDISKCNRERCSKEELPRLTFTFSLNNEDKKKIVKISPELSDEETLTIRRDGNGIQSYSIILPFEKQRPKLSATQNKLILEKSLQQKLIEQLSEKKIDVEKIIKNVIKRENSPFMKTSEKNQAYENKKIFRETEQELIKASSRIGDLQNEISEINVKLAVARNNMVALNENSMKKVLELFPSVIYYHQFELVPESIPIADVKEQKTHQARLVGNLLNLGKIPFSRLDEEHRRLKHIFKDASRLITKKFSEFWSQEIIEIEHQPNELAISINGRISISASPHERSEGFQWLLSFFSHFSTNFESDGKNTIFLIDEPAVLLHPRGKKDVLQILEQITEKNQIVYSTHSPFLINKNFPQRVRLLTKSPDNGTVINNKPYSDGKSNRFWEPLRSSIGVCLGDFLSLGKNNLIVEGISDQIILANLSNIFAKLGQPFINFEKVTIVPAMGAPSEEALARLATSEDLKAICLLDNDSKGKKVQKRLKNDEKIKLISVKDAKKDAITIEDLFPENVYIKAFNSVHLEYYNIEEYAKNDADKTSGIIGKIARQYKTIPDFEIDKVGVVNKIIKDIEINQDNISDYDGFKQLFTIVNKMQKEKTDS